ncbi:MAG: glycoside hydrolase family 88 protein, partial [Bacteroides sp.]
KGILDKEIYLPTLEQSWQALVAVVSDEGKLGFVQPIGADPKKVTEDMTAVYGVGAFLLAGNEIYKLTNEEKKHEKN